MECIAELRSKGYDVPLYPAEPQNDAEREIQKTYSTILGSAVNPVLREGNSDRRVAAPVKAYAQKNPHRMGMWSKAARTHVAHMGHGDFYESELAAIMPQATDVAIEFTPTSSGSPVTLKDTLPLEKGEVIDAAFISVKALCQFYEDEIEEAKETELLLSLVRRFRICAGFSLFMLSLTQTFTNSHYFFIFFLSFSRTAPQGNDDED